MTAEDLKASARRVAGEPFFKHLIKELRDHATTVLLERATTDEERRAAQCWHQVVSTIEASVRRNT